MKAIPRIPTRRSLPCRIWRAMEHSKVELAFYVFIAALVAASFQG